MMKMIMMVVVKSMKMRKKSIPFFQLHSGLADSGRNRQSKSFNPLRRSRRTLGVHAH